VTRAVGLRDDLYRPNFFDSGTPGAAVGDGVGVECDVPETALRFASQLSALEMSLRTGEGADVAAKHAQNMHDLDELQRKLLRLGDGAGVVLRASLEAREEATPRSPLRSATAPVPALSPRPAPSVRASAMEEAAERSLRASAEMLRQSGQSLPSLDAAPPVTNSLSEPPLQGLETMRSVSSPRPQTVRSGPASPTPGLPSFEPPMRWSPERSLSALERDIGVSAVLGRLDAARPYLEQAYAPPSAPTAVTPHVAYDDGVLERLLARVESPVAGIAATGPARLADRLRETQASEPALTPEEVARIARIMGGESSDDDP